MRKQTVGCLGAVVLSTTLVACGTKVPKPNSEIALSQSALESAELAGAREYAPIELRVAREKKASADKALANERYAQARYLSVEAKADAELARATAEVEKSRLELKRAQDGIQLLKDEAVPTSNTQ